MNNTNIWKIVEFLKTNDTAEKVNAVILQTEKKTKANIIRIQKQAEDLGINVSIDESQNISHAVGEETGIYYLRPAYKKEFEAYTTQINHMSDLFYSVRESVHDYYNYLNAEVKGTTVKMGAIHLFGEDEGIVIREYQNGYTVYNLTDELAERIELVYWLESIFASNRN